MIFFYTANKWPTQKKKKKCMWWAGLIGFHSDLLHGLQVGRHLAERRDSVVALGFYWICSVAGPSVTYLEVGACARLDVVRGEPLPHLNQGQAFFVIHVKHRLADGGREQRHSHRHIWEGGGVQSGRRVSLIEATYKRGHFPKTHQRHVWWGAWAPLQRHPSMRKLPQLHWRRIL